MLVILATIGVKCKNIFRTDVYNNNLTNSCADFEDLKTQVRHKLTNSKNHRDFNLETNFF